MKTKVRAHTFILFVLIISLLLGAGVPPVRAEAGRRKTFNILMIGNSLTFSSKHKQYSITHLKNLGKYYGYSFNIRYVAHDGEHLKNYSGGKSKRKKEVLRAINSKKWDFVVLQENTDDVIRKNYKFKSSVLKIANWVRKKNSSTKIILNCTWAYDKKRYGYSHAQQQKRMNEMYGMVGKCARATVVYTGDAFDAYRRTRGHANLYRPDKNHASNEGCYLNACCLYNTITGTQLAKVSSRTVKNNNVYANLRIASTSSRRRK